MHNWFNVVLHIDGEDWEKNRFQQEDLGFPVRRFFASFGFVTVTETIRKKTFTRIGCSSHVHDLPHNSTCDLIV